MNKKTDDRANDKAVEAFLAKYGSMLSEKWDIPVEGVINAIEGLGPKIDFKALVEADEGVFLAAFEHLWSKEKR